MMPETDFAASVRFTRRCLRLPLSQVRPVHCDRDSTGTARAGRGSLAAASVSGQPNPVTWVPGTPGTQPESQAVSSHWQSLSAEAALGDSVKLLGTGDPLIKCDRPPINAPQSLNLGVS
jgi:hypothetical protein